MIYNFDEPIDRRGTNSLKCEFLDKTLNVDVDCVPMWVADTDFRIAPCIAEALQNRMSHQILGYTLRTGSFYQAVADWQKRRHGWNVSPEWVSFCPGVVSGIAVAISQFTNPGDKILVQTPVYHPFFQTVRNLGRQVVFNSLLNVDGRAQIDFADLEQKANGATMLLLCNPHNPVGRVWSRQELERVADICRRNGVMVVSDEIHSDLVYAPNHFVPFATVGDWAATNSITLSAPSKAFNIAGLSTSYAIASNPDILKMYNAGLDAFHIGFGNVFGNVALESAYTDGADWLDQMLAYLDGNVNFAIDYAECNIPQMRIIRPEATFLLWCDCRAFGMEEEKLSYFFAHKAKVAVNMGSVFGPEGQGFVRMNIGCTRATLEKALNRIARCVKQQRASV